MQEKYRKELNKIKNSDDKLNKLITLFIKEKVSVQDLLEQDEIDLKISADTINKFAIKLDEGEDGVPQQKNNASKLFLHAAKKGHAWACRNVGHRLLYGIGGLKKNPSRAIHWLEIANNTLQDEEESDCLYLLANAYLEKGNKTKAQEYFRKAVKSSFSDNKKETKTLLNETLNSVYKKLEIPTNLTITLLLDDTQNLPFDELSEEEQQNVEISRISAAIDGYVPTTETSSVLALAQEKELERQIQTEKHYFSPYRTQKDKTREFAQKMQKNRLMLTTEQNEELNVTDQPARRLITAELSAVEASLRIFGRGNSWYDTEFGWTIAEKTTYQSSPVHHGNKEKIKLGNDTLSYKQRTNPHCNHLGDYHMESLGEYTNIIQEINNLTNGNSEKEQELATYMLRYSRKGMPIKKNELQQKIQENASDQDVTTINRIFYHCFVKEVVRWKLPMNPSHELPLATAQIRAVKLIEKGYLNMKDVFSQNSNYGVFTDKNIGQSMITLKEKINRINRLYLEAFLKGSAEGNTESKKNFSDYIKFFKTHKDSEFFTTRNELHKELKEGYGSGDDTDGEGYNSDTANELYPKGYTPF